MVRERIHQMTLRSFKHHSFEEYYESFCSLYEQLFLEKELSIIDRKKILSFIALFVSLEDENLRQLGYRMALQYSNVTADYTSLYDVSINTGLLPVVNKLRRIPDFFSKNADGFLSTITGSYIDCFRNDDIVFTEQQFRLNKFFNETLENSAIVIAPTSYGKSELIMSGISADRNRKVCIIVPSKALLSQTRKRIIDKKIDWIKRIVSHPEMHRPDSDDVIYILTQERLSRILTADRNMFFDLVFVDEAHNMLVADDRQTLLVSVIKILSYRNKNTAFKFLTPLLQHPPSLHLKDSFFETVDYKVHEYVKSEQIYFADYRGAQNQLLFYDQFLDRFLSLENEATNELEHVIDNSKKKNIVYLYRPRDVQDFSRRLSAHLPEIDPDLVRTAIQEIGDAMHQDYLLLKCLKHGVLYHHGAMPEHVRNYVEYLYSNCDEVSYLVSTSTLLEGVNMPIERMFLLDVRAGRGGNLTPQLFKNLIGRVNRFSEIFGIDGPEAIKIPCRPPD